MGFLVKLVAIQNDLYSMKETIANRRSIFPVQFSGAEVHKEEISELLRAANWAPTHRKTEPWRFKVLQGTKKASFEPFIANLYTKTVAKASTTKRNKIVEKVQQSAAILLICMQRDFEKSVPEWEEIAATAMAVQNLWLKATEIGLGGYWSSPSYCDQMDEFIPFETGEVCLGIFYLGRFEGTVPQRIPGDWEDKVQWYE